MGVGSKFGLAAAAFLIFSAAFAAGCGKQDVISGSASANQVQTQFTTGLACWNPEKRTATIGFVLNPLTSREISQILKDHSFFLSMIGQESKSPVVELNLVFQPDRSTAAPAYLERYFIGFYNYSESPMTLNFQSSDWSPKDGILELSGDLRRGGTLTGKFKRDHYFFKVPSKTIEYNWDLAFQAKLK